MMENQMNTAALGMLPTEPTKEVLEALGLKKQIAFIPDGSVARDKKKAQNLERQKRHQEKLRDEGKVNAWVPVAVAEAVKAGVELVPVTDTKENAPETPEAVALFAAQHGWGQVENCIRLRKHVHSMPKWKRWILGV